MIGVIDYDAGNVKSVMKAVEKLGGKVLLSSDIAVLDNCNALILPGVGSFGKAMENLKSSGLDRYILKSAVSNKMLLGICLGMQMLFDKSFEDGEWDGLGLIEGNVIKFGKENNKDWDEKNKIPHMGWNKLILNINDDIGNYINDNEYVYFVHSYYVVPKNWDDVVFYADYNVKVPAVVRKNNIIGMQFHPEKSSETGLKLLKNFLVEVKEIAD